MTSVLDGWNWFQATYSELVEGVWTEPMTVDVIERTLRSAMQSIDDKSQNAVEIISCDRAGTAAEYYEHIERLTSQNQEVDDVEIIG